MSTFDPRPSTPWIQLHAYAEAYASMPKHFRVQAEVLPLGEGPPRPKIILTNDGKREFAVSTKK